MMGKQLILLGCLMLAAQPSLAQTIGGSCTTAGSSVSGLLISGRYTDLICDGSTYQERRSWNLGTSVTPATTLLQVGYDSGSCTAAKHGQLSYNNTTDTFCLCSGTAWTKLGGTGSTC